jgi:hypothetical protein
VSAAAPELDLSPILVRRLREFVDREAEMKRFCQMLEEDRKRILVVSGESGSGKSSFLARMIQECATRRIRRAEVVWSETRAYDYMGVMRKIRDDLRCPEAFAPFNDLINFYTQPRYQLQLDAALPSTVRVAEGAQIQNSRVGDVIGVQVVIKDSMISIPRTDMAVPDSERMMRLTDLFLENLRQVATREPLVLFLDATEKMSPHTELWLWNELLSAGRDGKLANVRLVLCGQRRRELEPDWEDCTELAEMKPLGAEHILDYLRRRGVGDDATRPELARMLLAATEGKVIAVANLVDKFVRAPRPS